MTQKVRLLKSVLCLMFLCAFAGGLKAQVASDGSVQYFVKYSQGPTDDPVPVNTEPDCDVMVCISFSICMQDAAGNCIPGSQKFMSQCRLMSQNESFAFDFSIPQGWRVDEKSVQYSITPANFSTLTIPQIVLSDQVTTWTPTRCPRSTGLFMKMRNNVLYFWNAHNQ